LIMNIDIYVNCIHELLNRQMIMGV
jgi:hypothetical protein